jgi:hypothetical protein
MVAVQKRASGKGSSAAPKQVFRHEGHDTIALEGELLAGEPLLVEVFGAACARGRAPAAERGGASATEPALSLGAARARCAQDLAALDPALRSIAPRETDAFPVEKSAALADLHRRVDREGRAVL